MTMDEFFKDLETKCRPLGGWGVTSWQGIRTALNSTYVCPVTAVAQALSGKLFNIAEVYTAAEVIGLSKKDADLLADAADRGAWHDSAIRQRLLDALGITESAV